MKKSTNLKNVKKKKNYEFFNFLIVYFQNTTKTNGEFSLFTTKLKKKKKTWKNLKKLQHFTMPITDIDQAIDYLSTSGKTKLCVFDFDWYVHLMLIWLAVWRFLKFC